ncbi:MAG: hypothetical protein ABI365_06965 [Lysobacteraceae bacterium]
MKDIEVGNTAATAVHESTTSGSQRAAYTSPVLHVYGSVSKLTMGATGTGPDGVMMTMTPRMGGGLG